MCLKQNFILLLMWMLLQVLAKGRLTHSEVYTKLYYSPAPCLYVSNVFFQGLIRSSRNYSAAAPRLAESNTLWMGASCERSRSKRPSINLTYESGNGLDRNWHIRLLRFLFTSPKCSGREGYYRVKPEREFFWRSVK